MWRRIAYRCGISRQRRFLKDRRGAAALEFAFVFPVFIVMVVTVMELSYHFLIGSVIESAALEASRFGLTGQSGAGTETREERIVRIVKENTYDLINPDDLVIDTLVYDSFSDIGKPEPFVDENDNGQYDNGEVYTDGEHRWVDYSGHNTTAYGVMQDYYSNENQAKAFLNQQLSTVCTSMKDNDIEVYTIAFGEEVNNSTTILDLMEGCATTSTRFFAAPTPEDLQVAFKKIGKALQALRISK